MSKSRSRWRRAAVGLLSGGLLGSLTASPAHAQPPMPHPMPQPAHAAPQYQAPPLMFVRIAGPQGMKVTLYRGLAKGETILAPAVVGLRPGYAYRIALSDVPDRPGRVFYPTLEVRASLYLGNRLLNADFPAAINFSAEDFARSDAGALVRKVVVLETPDRAIPLPTRADDPLEVRVPRNRDLFEAANDHGQPLVLVQMGQREWTKEELAFSGIGGTVLMPGEKALGQPRVPPSAPWTCFPVVDPMAGPVDPRPYTCLPDGGDSGLPIGYGRDGKLRGVDPSDTVAEYLDGKGRRRLVVSNRVCLIVPRFVVVRGETQPVGQVGLIGIGRATVANGFDVVVNQQGALTNSQKTALEVTAQKQRASGTVNLVGTAIVGRIRGLELKSSLRNVTEVDGMCLRPEQPAEDLPLYIIKWPDKTGALIGDEVTFTLRFTNRGGQPISDVAVTDSLAPRFEYINGSAKTDREAIFTMQPNAAGSTILRWQFSGVLQPHESGTVTFRVRVR
jgi:uncharacterized repeat protein (TIGR01451 family)